MLLDYVIGSFWEEIINAQLHNYCSLGNFSIEYFHMKITLYRVANKTSIFNNELKFFALFAKLLYTLWLYAVCSVSLCDMQACEHR